MRKCNYIRAHNNMEMKEIKKNLEGRKIVER